jgi:glucose/mannose transport system substrate-binding protein
MLRKFIILISAVTFLALALSACANKSAIEKNLEIFSWWTTDNDTPAINKVFELYAQENPAIRVINASQAVGTESIAQAVLLSRMQGGDPPDSFQTQVGRELIDTWVVSGKLDNLDDVYQSEGWNAVFPKGVLDLVSFQGHYYAVPVSIYRANMLWYNRKTFATLGVTSAPQTFDEWFNMADKCQAAGISALALGDSARSMASVNLFETILIGNLGADSYKGLFAGTTLWTDPRVTTSLETFKKMLGYVNPDHATLTWSQANQLVIEGKACTIITGDWADQDNQAKKFTDSGWAPAPNNTGIYDAQSDAFVIPKGARDPNAAREWLILIGSKAGQEALNPLNGSICARIDCDAQLFGAYLQWAGQEWAKDTVVPSLGQGVATSPGWLAAIGDAINTFVTSQDVAATQALLLTACTEAKICK